jgi:hypothetical protein
MSSRNMCLLPRATLHSDSEQYSTLKHVVLLPCHHGKVYSVRLVSFVTQTRISIYAFPMLQLNCGMWEEHWISCQIWQAVQCEQSPLCQCHWTHPLKPDVARGTAGNQPRHVNVIEHTLWPQNILLEFWGRQHCHITSQSTDVTKK